MKDTLPSSPLPTPAVAPTETRWACYQQYMSEESEWSSPRYSLSSPKLSSYVSSVDPSPLRMNGRRLSLESELPAQKRAHTYQRNKQTENRKMNKNGDHGWSKNRNKTVGGRRAGRMWT